MDFEKIAEAYQKKRKEELDGELARRLAGNCSVQEMLARLAALRGLNVYERANA